MKGVVIVPIEVYQDRRLRRRHIRVLIVIYKNLSRNLMPKHVYPAFIVLSLDYDLEKVRGILEDLEYFGWLDGSRVQVPDLGGNS